jgi:hypothetical protein
LQAVERLPRVAEGCRLPVLEPVAVSLRRFRGARWWAVIVFGCDLPAGGFTDRELRNVAVPRVRRAGWCK